MEQFIGVKYKLKTSDNFEDYLKCINVGFVLRKLALTSSPVCCLSRESDVYTITLVAPIKTISTVFKINEEFEEDRADGQKVKSIITVDGNKLIQVQIEPSGKKSTHVREFTPDKLTVTTTVEGWDGQCVRVYEKV